MQWRIFRHDFCLGTFSQQNLLQYSYPATNSQYDYWVVEQHCQDELKWLAQNLIFLLWIRFMSKYLSMFPYFYLKFDSHNKEEVGKLWPPYIIEYCCLFNPCQVNDIFMICWHVHRWKYNYECANTLLYSFLMVKLSNLVSDQNYVAFFPLFFTLISHLLSVINDLSTCIIPINIFI